MMFKGVGSNSPAGIAALAKRMLCKHYFRRYRGYANNVYDLAIGYHDILGVRLGGRCEVYSHLVTRHRKGRVGLYLTRVC
jgi:hypothetical protein